VFERGLHESLSLGHNYMGTEHILLGLISEDAGVVFRTRPGSGSDREEYEGVAVGVLHDLGVDADRIRNEVIRLLSGPDAGAYAVSRASDVSSETSMNVNPSAIVRRLLMSATARALDGGRSEIDVADLLLVLTSDEATSQLLTSLGVDVATVRDTLERKAPPD
jgi:ATP-dependent Clp protease ATP-binding subunit ClpC